MSPEQSPFHAGELAIQERAGVREQVAGFGSRAIRTFMPDRRAACCMGRGHRP